MELNQCINFLLTKAQQAVFQFFKARLADYDVTPVQYGILGCLWEENGQTPKQIAYHLSLDGSTITGILDRMENKGLVQRTPDPNDRRALRVILTEKGMELQEPIQEIIYAANEKVLEAFSQDDRDKLQVFLERFDNLGN
ncbi:MAG: MarR family winged helix-turn-helix transcriptional regulator [Peptococcaceae bacterium]